MEVTETPRLACGGKNLASHWLSEYRWRGCSVEAKGAATSLKDTRGKPEEASEMAEPISAAYMHWPHSTSTLSTRLSNETPPTAFSKSHRHLTARG